MIYTLIISLLIEKPFYLLSPQSFSFQIVSEFIDIFVKFSKFISRGWGFRLPFLSLGKGFVDNDCPRGRIFAPFKSCPGGMVMDETDICITCPSDKLNRISGAVYTSIIPLFFLSSFLL